MDLNIKYGHSVVKLYAADDAIEWIAPKSTAIPSLPEKLVAESIRRPVSPLSLPSHIQSVAIAINDKTRPVPHSYLLPPLLAYLKYLGISNQQITFFIASGTHSPMPSDEFSLILPGDMEHQFTVLAHNCDDLASLTDLGKSSAGTHILVNSRYYNSDLKIVVGNIEPHHFMGFSGGHKTASIGLTGRSTINHNHSFLLSDDAVTGEVDHNPCRLDVEEIGQIIGTQLALNAILDPDKAITHCLFGDPLSVMQSGIPLSRAICQVPVSHPYDLVLASPGGYPKDINLYQAQKAITNAAAITRDGGSVLLFAECKEGTGSKSFEDFMRGVASPDEALNKFAISEFQIGPHKGFQLAKQARRIHLFLVSSMPTDLVTGLFITPLSIDEAQDLVRQSQNLLQRIAFMPSAVTTIPYLLDKPSRSTPD